jgi:hypothetical protein
MSEYRIEKRIGDLWVSAYGLEPTHHPHFTAFMIGFTGESERIQLHNIEEVRDLHYAIGAILAEADRKMRP